MGIITVNDVLGVLLQAIGINEESARFSVLVKDRVGVMADVTKILKDHAVNIRSLFTWPEITFPGAGLYPQKAYPKHQYPWRHKTAFFDE